MSFFQFLLQWFLYFRFWHGGKLHVALGSHFQKVVDMAAVKKASATPNLQFPELDVDGLTISLLDAAGWPAPMPDPTTVTTSYVSSDPSVLTVAGVAGNPYSANVTSTGKIGTGVVIGATLNFNSGAPSLKGTSPAIDVPAGAPASVSVTLGTPTAPTP